jgi:chromosome segregation ATPase
MSTALKTIHDQLLELKPEDCPLCVAAADALESASNSHGGSVSEKTYTEAEYNALASQVADLEGKLAELAAASTASEIDAAVASAKAEIETQVADLQSQLDTAVLEAEASFAEAEQVLAELQRSIDVLTDRLDAQAEEHRQAVWLLSDRIERQELLLTNLERRGARRARRSEDAEPIRDAFLEG